MEVQAERSLRESRAQTRAHAGAYANAQARGRVRADAQMPLRLGMHARRGMWARFWLMPAGNPTGMPAFI